MINNGFSVMKDVPKVELERGKPVFIILPDGSNLCIQLDKFSDMKVEVSTYTSNIEGTYKEAPVLHLKNTNTFDIELRRFEGKPLKR